MNRCLLLSEAALSLGIVEADCSIEAGVDEAIVASILPCRRGFRRYRCNLRFL